MQNARAREKSESKKRAKNEGEGEREDGENDGRECDAYSHPRKNKKEEKVNYSC